MMMMMMMTTTTTTTTMMMMMMMMKNVKIFIRFFSALVIVAFQVSLVVSAVL